MKVYVGNLSFNIDDEKLREIFSKFGEVEEATIIKDKFSGRSKGFGFVTFTDDAAAKKAIEELNDKEVEGRALKVNEARPMEDRPPRRDFGNRGGGGDRPPRRDFGGSGGRGRRF
jgi:RNA recognition motif-containing protein